jgi:hypothetical protein
MTYNELIQLFFERSNALQWYWTLYVVIIGGLLAFASLRKEPDRLTTILVTVLFCCFAYKNLGAIHDVTMQRVAVLQAIDSLAAHLPDITGLNALLKPNLVAPDYEGVRNFHVACDVLTVAALWAMELRRKRHARTANAALAT